MWLRIRHLRVIRQICRYVKRYPFHCHASFMKQAIDLSPQAVRRRTRQYVWRREARHRLLRSLGSYCAACGERDDLTFDCISPCGHAHHNYGALRRICFYRQQWRLGNLQLLCTRCNVMKGDLTPAMWRDVVQRARSRTFQWGDPSERRHSIAHVIRHALVAAVFDDDCNPW